MLRSRLHLQSAVGGIDECGTVDLPQNQQGAHLMSLRCKKQRTEQMFRKLSLLRWWMSTPVPRWASGGSGGAEELVPCCRPGAGQCSCSHPTVSGQPWPGEGGWLEDTKTFTSSHHRLWWTPCPPPTRVCTHLRCHCDPYQQRPSGQNVHFCPPC